MQRHRFPSLATLLALVITFASGALVAAQPVAPGDSARVAAAADTDAAASTAFSRPLDRPDPASLERNRARQTLLEAGQYLEAQSLAVTGATRALVVLVEYGGPDTFTWQPGDTWDPLGRADTSEGVYDEDARVAVGDCSKIITETRSFTYSGPRHNQIPRPLSPADRSGITIWTEDFSKSWYEAFLFGNGVTFDYARQDGSEVREDFTGQSVRDYYLDMSGGRHEITGDVVGWLALPHSAQWYGADACPGRRSGDGGDAPHAGGIPNAGSEQSFVADTLKAVNAISHTIAGFRWQNYDADRDGVIDRLWIVHAGYGEEEDATLLNRTEYGEGALWSRSNAAAPPIPVAPGLAVGPYLIMPENGGIGVFAHEYAHSLGAIDLHTGEGGTASAGFWTIMADDWTGYPAGFEPSAPDPLHLDQWGWLDPLVIRDPAREYVFKLGQASRFEGGEGAYRGAKIELPESGRELPVPVWGGARYWWGGNEASANARMTLRLPLLIPPEGAMLSFEAAYRTRTGVDFLWVQASEDGENWTTLTNGNTTCHHASDWIGAANGFPDDLCGAGMGGFSGANATYPAADVQLFDLAAFANKRTFLRFWYMTDAGAPLEGPFIDNARVASPDVLLLLDDAEGPDARWIFDGPWTGSNGAHTFTQNFYLQWRNVSASGGYDSALGDARSQFGPANSGLLVWHNNNYYADNEITRYLRDYPAFGPKGKLLVVDAHPTPYRDPGVIAAGFGNEGANLPSRGQMRDAPFSLKDSVSFGYPSALPGSADWLTYPGRPAVPAFHDAFGYYPGAEAVIRGPAHSQTVPKWTTRQWDASAVVPAKSGYGIKAPGMRFDSPLLHRCEANLEGPQKGVLNCYVYQSGLGYEGGTGNPGDILAQYGWHAEILDQTDGSATIRVWNALKSFGGAVTQTPSTRPALMGSVVKVDIQATNTGSPTTGLFITPLDDEEEYIEGSAYGGAYPVTAAEARAMAGIARDAGLSTAEDAAAVIAVAASSRLVTGGAVRFGFSTRIMAERGEITRSVGVFEGSTFLNELAGESLAIGQAAQTVREEFAAVADAHVAAGIPRTNFGQWPFIYIGGNDVLRSLLRFDLSSINAAYPVDEATLYVYVTAFGGGGSPANLASYEVTTGWQEAMVTWSAPWQTPGGDAASPANGLSPITKADAGKWVKVDVTGMARKWVANPAANHGALLRLVDATSYTTYRLVSRDNGWMRAYAPKLVVTYRRP